MELAKITTFEQLKGELGNELHKAAISFIRIGYLLKLARDGNILAGTSYADVNDFATAEFGLDKTQVSRFIRINDRFSIGGYSEHLKEEYESYGSAKLSLMLTLPDEINQELSPEFSKSDIQAIKEEYDEETKITDIEVLLEKKDETLPDEFIAAVVRQLNDEHPQPAAFFQNTMLIAREMTLEPNVEDVKEAYMPDGDRTYNIRISGQGRFMVNFRTDEITIVNMRAPEEKSTVSWEEFLQTVKEDVDGREFEEKEEKTENKRVASSREQKKIKADKKSGFADKKKGIPTKNEEKPTENPEKAEIAPVQQEAEKVEGEILDTDGKRIENTEENLPFPDGEEPEITHVSQEDPLPEESDREGLLLSRLADLIKGGQYNKTLEYLNDIEGFRNYRYQLDRISEWVAGIKNTTDALYAELASKGQ